MTNMKTMSKWVVGSLALGAAVCGGELGAYAQQPALTAAPAALTANTQLNCAGITALHIEVERPRDLKVTSSKLVGASSWTTSLALTGKISTVDGRMRACAPNGAA